MLLLRRVLSFEHIAGVVAQCMGKTAERIFTPFVTLAVFLAQILSDDHSCRGAFAQLLAWRVAHGLKPCSSRTVGYCKAHQRLPEDLLPRLVRETAGRIQDGTSGDWLFRGRRVVIAEGSTVSMPGTP